jgi:hypothetical protein
MPVQAPGEFPEPPGETGGRLPVPPIDAVVGHWFADGEVHVVFTEGDGRQFFLLKETLERCYGTFLGPDQTWARRDPPAPLRGIARDQGMLRAYHEAGHAVACTDEGIKVEYVTILPHRGWNGERLLGYCQYDYRLPEALEQECPAWAEKAAKADLGGPLADYLYRSRNGMDMPEEVRYAWRYDRSKARRDLAKKAAKESKKVHLDRELDRLWDAVATRFQEPWAWAAISRVADRLCDEGAICGQVVKEVVEQAKDGPGDTSRPMEVDPDKGKTEP